MMTDLANKNIMPSMSCARSDDRYPLAPSLLFDAAPSGPAPFAGLVPTTSAYMPPSTSTGCVSSYTSAAFSSANALSELADCDFGYTDFSDFTKADILGSTVLNTSDFVSEFPASTLYEQPRQGGGDSGGGIGFFPSPTPNNNYSMCDDVSTPGLVQRDDEEDILSNLPGSCHEFEMKEMNIKLERHGSSPLVARLSPGGASACPSVEENCADPEDEGADIMDDLEVEMINESFRDEQKQVLMYESGDLKSLFYHGSKDDIRARTNSKDKFSEGERGSADRPAYTKGLMKEAAAGVTTTTTATAMTVSRPDELTIEKPLTPTFIPNPQFEFAPLLTPKSEAFVTQRLSLGGGGPPVVNPRRRSEPAARLIWPGPPAHSPKPFFDELPEPVSIPKRVSDSRRHVSFDHNLFDLDSVRSEAESPCDADDSHAESLAHDLVESLFTPMKPADSPSTSFEVALKVLPVAPVPPIVTHPVAPSADEVPIPQEVFADPPALPAATARKEEKRARKESAEHERNVTARNAIMAALGKGAGRERAGSTGSTGSAKSSTSKSGRVLFQDSESEEKARVERALKETLGIVTTSREDPVPPDDEEEDSWENFDESAMDDLNDRLAAAKLESKAKAAATGKKAIDYFAKPTERWDPTVLPHVLEAHSLPSSWREQDVRDALAQLGYGDASCKWLPSLGSSAFVSFPTQAKAVEALTRSFGGQLHLRRLADAPDNVKREAIRVTIDLAPPARRQRTNVSTARRMVESALGQKSTVSKETRQRERDELKAAKEQKRAEKDLWK